MLNDLNISLLLTLPIFFITVNIGGTGHDVLSINTCVFTGKILGMFSNNPPPVICAIPFISIFSFIIEKM